MQAIGWASMGFVAMLLWPGAAASQASTGPVVLRTVQDELTAQPPISDASPTSVVGVQLARDDERTLALDIGLRLPVDAALPAKTCVSARSQDARLTFLGEYHAAGPVGPVRVKGDLKAPNAAYLASLPLRQLALLAQLGPCNAAVEGLLRFVVADPRPSASAPATQLRVLLNAPEGRIGLGWGASEAAARAAPDQACTRSKARETGAFTVECLVDLPTVSPAYVEIRRHRFGNSPLIDRFVLLAGAR